MKATLKYHGLTILWALFIFIMCSAKLDSVDDSPMFFEGFDKLTHTGLFFTLIVLFCNGIIRQQKIRSFSYKQVLVVTAASVFFGGLIEILQRTVFTWRSGDWNDMFCDMLGICMGIFGVMLTLSAIGNEKK